MDNKKNNDENIIDRLRSNFANITNRSSIICWLEQTIYLLKKYPCSINHYNDIISLYYSLIFDLIDDQHFHHLSPNIDNFLIEFEKIFSSKCSSNNSSEWNQLSYHDYFCKKLNSITFNQDLLGDDPLFSSTIPIVLRIMILISLKFHSLTEIVYIVKEIQNIIVTNYNNLKQHQHWTSLNELICRSIQVFTPIIVSSELNRDILNQKHYLLLLLNIGIGVIDEKYPFIKTLVTRALHELITETNIPLMNHFLNFQKDIGKLLSKKLQKKFDLNIIRDCSEYLDIDMYSNESSLACIIIDFIIECDERIFQLLDQINIKRKLEKKAKISVKFKYFSDSIVHLFFMYPDDTNFLEKIYKMILFISHHFEFDAFELFQKIDKELSNTILKRFELSYDRTLKALSFIYLTSKLETVDNLMIIYRIDLNYFQKHDDEFRRILQQKFFPFHINVIDHYLMRNDHYYNQIEEKIIVCKSFLKTLQMIGDKLLNIYRIRIYYLVRLILNENCEINPIIEIGMDIFEHFIIHVDRNYLQQQFLSICLLISSFSEALPRQTVNLLKLLFTHDSILITTHQLSFLCIQTNNSLQQLLNNLMNDNEKVKMMIIPHSSVKTITTNGTSSLPSTINSYVDDNNNDTSDDNENSPMISEKKQQLINLIKYDPFIQMCKQVYFLLQKLYESIEINLEENILQQIYKLLESNRDIYYLLCEQRTIDDYDFSIFLANMRIDIEEINDKPQQKCSSKEITLQKYFQTIILVMFKCLKFSKRSEIQKLAANCLGQIGAISSTFLNFNVPFSNDDYRFDIKQSAEFIENRSTMIDYSNKQLFIYKKRSFKLLVLNILMDQIQNSYKSVDYNTGNYAVQNILPLFTDTSISRTANLLGCSNFDFDTQNIQNNAISTQKIEQYVKNIDHFTKENISDDSRRTKTSPISQEFDFYDRCDQIKQFLLNERNEYLSESLDLSEELKNFRIIYESSSMKAKDLCQRSVLEMEHFFNNSIKPTMCFAEFIQSFIDMLYYSFIIPKIKENRIEPSCEAFSQKKFNEMCSQIYSSMNRHSVGNFADTKSELSEFKSRIHQLQTPISFFLYCYYSIMKNIRLSYVLLPGLFVVAIGCGSKDDQQKFTNNFRHMIEDKFISSSLMFSSELGPMVSELVCCLHDFLTDWTENRCLAHKVVIGSKLIENSTMQSLDNDYYGVKLFMQKIDNILLTKLCCRSRNYSRALRYLENSAFDYNNNGNTGNTQSNLCNEFVLKNFDLYFDIYHGLEDKEALQGLFTHITDFTSYRLTLYQELCYSITKDDLLGQMVYTNQLIEISKLIEDDKSQSFNVIILQERVKDLYNSEQLFLPFWIAKNFDYSFLSNEKYQMFKNKCIDELSRWDLSNRIETNSNQADINGSLQYGTGIGEIFSAMFHKKSLFLLDSISSEVRQNSLIHLKASLLTNSSRAYDQTFDQSIIKLHIIHDIQQFITNIYERLLMIDDNDNQNSGDESQSAKDQLKKIIEKILSSWRLRNKIVPIGCQRLQVLDVQRSLIKLLLKYEEKLSDEISCNLLEESFRLEHDTIRCSLKSGNLYRASISLAEAFNVREKLSRRTEFNIIDEEAVDFLLDHAQVLWCRNQTSESIALLRMELQKHYYSIQRECYVRALKNSTPIPKNDLYILSNLFSLNLSPAQINQMSGDTILSSNSSSNSISMRASARLRNDDQNDEEISESKQDLLNYGRIQLQFAKYSDFSDQLSSLALQYVYKTVTIACPKWEDGHFHLAMYYRRLYQHYLNSNSLLKSKTGFLFGKLNEILDLKARTIKSICDSLQYGSYKYVRISLPIMFDILFELGYQYLTFLNKLSTKDERTKTLHDICKVLIDRSISWIRGLLSSKINDAIFLIVLDKLIGHMLHPSAPIAKLVEDILKRLIANFPHHMAWLISRSLTSKIGRRGIKTKELIRAAQKTLEDECNEEQSIVSYFAEFSKFSDCLQRLACYGDTRNTNRRTNVNNRNEISLGVVVPNLNQCVQNGRNFLLPFNQLFLPNSMNLERLLKQSRDQEHYFRSIYIIKFDDKAQMMPSIQCPKRVIVYCDDGIKREILVKSGDDLRRDCAMLTYLNLFNQCYRGELPIIEPLSKIDIVKNASQSELNILANRRRNPLVAKTFFAVPLNDTFGVIEWIPGLHSLKSIAEKQYSKSKSSKKYFLSARNAFIKSVNQSCLTREKRVERFLQHFKNFQPPVLQNWFQEYYADAFSWCQARKNFIRSSAVFSMLGYILGLGDRHTDNVMLDTRTGSMVQVDFNCLFNRGEEFVVPELVPFRLTHNMIAAMGTNGYEGSFRYTCEDVLLVCRQYRELFLSPVQIFLYDELCEWSVRNSNRDEIAEKSVFNVEARLCGIATRSLSKLPRGNILSVNGQVKYAIEEATNINNLGALYYGWAAYI